MIWYEVKNYLKNLLYVFLPALLFYTLIVLISFLLITSSITSLTGFLNSNITFEEGKENELINMALEYIKTIDFSQFFINLFTNIKYVPSLVTGFFEYLKANSVTITEGAEELSLSYGQNVQNMIIAGLIVYLVGVLLTNILCSILIAKRCKLVTGLKRTIIKAILSSIVFATVISFTTIFIEKYEWLNLISAPLLFILNLIASLITAWAVQKSKKMKFTKVVNAKNIFALLIMLICILAIYFGIHYGISLLVKNATLASLISVPFYLYTYAFYGVSGEILVMDIRRHNV